MRQPSPEVARLEHWRRRSGETPQSLADARRLTQKHVAGRIGVDRARISQLETGHGANAPLELWVKLGIALQRPLAVAFSRDIKEPLEPRDAGHLAAQELVLRLARQHRRRSNIELATKPWDPARSADVVLADDRQRAVILLEIVNRVGDIGASFRTSDRKAAELERYAILAGGDPGPYRVAVGWLLVDSAANRVLIRKYPEVFRTRFGGSSVALTRCLVQGAPPPSKPALAWIAPAQARVSPLRLRT